MAIALALLVLPACPSAPAASTPEAAPEATREPAPEAARQAPPGTVAPAPAPPPTPTPPRFEARARALTEAEKVAMRGVSWHPGCPLALEALAYLELTHWDFEGEPRTGALVLDAAQTEAITEVFRELFEARFPIRQLRPIEAYAGDDAASMADDNSSAFNCRKAVGTTHFSQHAYGRAIDLNPLENPYVKGDEVLPPAGRDHLDRSAATPGMVHPGGPAVRAFEARGWKWGGRWRSLKDFQHFSVTGT